jgi:hypothetical protein
MLEEGKDYEEREPKELAKNASPREKLKYIKDLALFHKSMMEDLSFSDLHDMLDYIIGICNDR